MDSVEPGRACGSDTAHLGIFGYEPRETYRGRGAFESLGAGCAVEPGDIAFKCNFATIDESSEVVLHRRVDRTFDLEGPVLCDHLDGEIPRLNVELRIWQTCENAAHILDNKLLLDS
jgi:2,3-bisphosphoglycerate-independent phosphoglycerate mutase